MQSPLLRLMDAINNTTQGPEPDKLEGDGWMPVQMIPLELRPLYWVWRARAEMVALVEADVAPYAEYVRKGLGAEGNSSWTQMKAFFAEPKSIAMGDKLAELDRVLQPLKASAEFARMMLEGELQALCSDFRQRHEGVRHEFFVDPLWRICARPAKTPANLDEFFASLED